MTSCLKGIIDSLRGFFPGDIGGWLANFQAALRTFALIVCAQRYCAGNATVICHALLRALVKFRF